MRYRPRPLQELVTQIFSSAGCDPAEAACISDHLVQANLTGHDSHGVIRTPIYVQWLREGKVRANQQAKKSGVAVIALRNTGHVGRVGHWAEMIVNAGLISLHFVNTSGLGMLVAP